MCPVVSGFFHLTCFQDSRILCHVSRLHFFCPIFFYCGQIHIIFGRPSWLSGKDLPANGEDASSISESGRSPGEGNSNPVQYSCLGNSMDRETGGLQSMGLRVRHDLATKQ